MKTVLICYSLGKVKDSIRSAFKREFIGYIDKSNNGAYTYERKGLLGKIPNIKPAKGVIIIRAKDENKVKSLLKKYKSDIKSFNIEASSSIFH